ncbi:hypothetical protein EDB85DRAFT_1890417 [Lactarius pseudohatsudake]|nr:hypothetical protein EDB85DRAFT_1890417 [Lactarius pseudohatsudake]
MTIDGDLRIAAVCMMVLHTLPTPFCGAAIDPEHNLTESPLSGTRTLAERRNPPRQSPNFTKRDSHSSTYPDLVLSIPVHPQLKIGSDDQLLQRKIGDETSATDVEPVKETKSVAIASGNLDNLELMLVEADESYFIVRGILKSKMIHWSVSWSYEAQVIDVAKVVICSPGKIHPMIVVLFAPDIYQRPAASGKRLHHMGDTRVILHETRGMCWEHSPGGAHDGLWGWTGQLIDVIVNTSVGACAVPAQSPVINMLTLSVILADSKDFERQVP